MCVLESLFKQMMSGQSVAPRSVVSRLRFLHPGFRPYAQSDAHEFLIKVLERVEENLLAPFASAKLDYETKCTTILHQIFGRWTQSEVTCPECRFCSKTLTMELSTTLEINKIEDLDSALKRYTSLETLTQGNEWMCTECKKNVRATKKFSFVKPPVILSLQLKRFKMNGSEPIKLTRKVRFPLRLNFNPYLSKQAKITYKLQSIVVHMGSVYSGHYIAYVRAPNDAWYEMNDDCVKIVSLERVLNAEAYLLFYTIDDLGMLSDVMEKRLKRVKKEKRKRLKFKK